MIYNLLDELDDILEESKPVPFSKMVGVSKEQISELLGDIRLNLPSVIKQSQRIADNCEKILGEARQKGEDIIKEAEETAERMASEHEITKRAREQAETILEDARATARELRIGAMEYADSILADAEQTLRDSLEVYVKQASGVEDFLARECDILYENRQELKNSNRNEEPEEG